MRDIPIIFSAPMVRALLAGHKTMTRRMLYSERKIKKGVIPPLTGVVTGERDGRTIVYETPVTGLTTISVPTGWEKVKPGDRLWVRENFAAHTGGIIRDAAGGQMDRVDPELVYAASQKRPDAMKWTPCIHMPRWASRLTLEVTAVKIERLNALTDDDAIREGIVKCKYGYEAQGATLPSGAPVVSAQPRLAFAALWDVLHGSGEWLSNPWVVALAFKVHKQNIDTLARAA